MPFAYETTPLAIQCAIPSSNDTELEITNLTGRTFNSNLSISCKDMGFAFKGLTEKITVNISCWDDSLWKNSDRQLLSSFSCEGLIFQFPFDFVILKPHLGYTLIENV